MPRDRFLGTAALPASSTLPPDPALPDLTQRILDAVAPVLAGQGCAYVVECMTSALVKVMESAAPPENQRKVKSELGKRLIRMSREVAKHK